MKSSVECKFFKKIKIKCDKKFFECALKYLHIVTHIGENKLIIGDNFKVGWDQIFQVDRTIR